MSSLKLNAPEVSYFLLGIRKDTLAPVMHPLTSETVTFVG